MNLQIARGVFLLASLALATVAVAAWDEPQAGVLRAEAGQGLCPFPRVQKSDTDPVIQPGHNMLLLMFGLTQGLRSGA
ncbi:hypothetical protein [Pseudomonas sp. RIT-PI-S]|uniref:hypothetical protein n=1 Tax=Pseudomonas sp. RIT-PI-S TaxID=3035295 RepID=UPI0021D89129|nr:hypothetical protein [Pseudomonas sp. RIT-PI-S]